MRLWRLVNVRGAQRGARKDEHGNIIVTGAPGVVIFKQVQPYTTNEQLIIYRSAQGVTAHLTGTEGKEVTDRLPQERWDEIHSQSMAAFAMLGRVPENLLKEII